MSKLGNGIYGYPARDVEDCREVMRKAWETANKYVFTRQEFADSIGKSPVGGNFSLLAGSLSAYGLCEMGNGQIKFSELGKIALFGKNGEDEEAMKKAVRNVALFAQLVDRFGNDISEERIRLFLKNDAQVDISELKAIPNRSAFCLRETQRYLSRAKADDFTR